MEIKVNLLPKQLEFINSTAREVLYSGGFGSGKSVALCYKLIMRASQQGTREALVRKTLPALKRSTLKTLLEGDGKMPPILPANAYVWNKNEGCINIKNGGQIMIFSLDTPEKCLSQNLSGVAIDEATELSESDYDLVKSRIRVAAIKYHIPQIYSCCNPASPSHHLYRRFHIGGDKRVRHIWDEKTHLISAPTTENFFLPQDYVEDLAATTGVYNKRYFLGQWVTQEGLIYDRFNRDEFVCDKLESVYKKIIISIDPGFTHRTGMLVIGIDHLDNIHVLDEWCFSGKINNEIVRAAQDFCDIYKIDTIVVDSAAPSLVEELRRSGLHAQPTGKKDVAEGIRIVQQCFRIIDGLPKITISTQCKQLISELESYSWQPGTDKPVKEVDDAADALRYGCVFLLGKKSVVSIRSFDDVVLPPEPREPVRSPYFDVEDDDDRCWSNTELLNA